jgi:hypothetical protein
MLNKLIVFAVVVMAFVSPFLPKVMANYGYWYNTISDKVWEYDSHTVERLAFRRDVQGPYNFSDNVFFADEAKKCSTRLECNQVDISIVKNGELLEINDVNEDITSRNWHIKQNDEFVYYVEAEGDYNWLTAFKYDGEIKGIDKLTALTRKNNEIKFNSFATEGDRLYGELIQEDKYNGDVEPGILVRDFESGYERRDISKRLTAPWQEIVDVYGDLVLVKFQFEGGPKQLWIIDERRTTMSAIYDTWTENPGDIVGAHFKSDGTVEYFKNYRLFTFDPKTQSRPTEHSGVYLNWFEGSNKTMQILGDRTAWLDPENNLYVNDLDGVRKMGQVIDGQFTLLKDSIFFVSENGYEGYDFKTSQWSKRSYHVTDLYQDILVGIDSDNDVWYENTSTNKLVNVGFGTDPVLSDRAHAYWKGMDGYVYEVSFKVLLDAPSFEKPQAYKAYDDSTVYLLEDGEFMKVNDEKVYFSWFNSWDNVAEVTPRIMELYLEKYGLNGDAPFAPGTRVKTAGNPRVYVMGTDAKLHWLVSETVADSIYGSYWNNEIIELPHGYLWKYGTGYDLHSSSDIKSI